MKLEHTKNIRRALREFPKQTQEAFYKQIEYLRKDIRHPSLRAKKYGGTTDVWQARVTDTVRFYFQIMDDTYHLLDIRKHPK
jgi:mRNA-degrading endonuclease RelE of RelBE toxin-antitoxin system